MCLIPKRPDITGAPNQVFKFDNFLDQLIGGIKGNTIATIGTISPGSLCIQYLHTPQIHYNLAGHPITLVGNSSNKEGEFRLIKINVTSICLFPYVKDKATMDSTLTHGDDFPKDLLTSMGRLHWPYCWHPCTQFLHYLIWAATSLWRYVRWWWYGQVNLSRFWIWA